MSDQTYSIQQTAQLSGLPESTLRYYESMHLIPPIKRNASSKHREYSEKDLELIVTVSCLSATGMSIDDMKTYMQSAADAGSAVQVQIELLRSQAEQLKQEEKDLQIRKKYVQAKIAYWETVATGDKTAIEDAKQFSISIARKLKNVKQTKGEK